MSLGEEGYRKIAPDDSAIWPLRKPSRAHVSYQLPFKQSSLNSGNYFLASKINLC